MIRPREHRIGDAGEFLVAHVFVQYGWIVEKLNSDYGFDFLLQRVEGEIVTGDFALLQVKATESGDALGMGRPPALKVTAKHRQLWESTPIPTFLVLVDLNEERLFIADCRRSLTDMKQEVIGSALPKDGSRRLRPDQFLLLTKESASQIAADVADYWTRIRSAILSSGTVRWLTGIGRDIASLPHGPILSLLNLNAKLIEILGPELADSVTMNTMRSLFGQAKKISTRSSASTQDDG